jgi:hypothetical protein
MNRLDGGGSGLTNLLVVSGGALAGTGKVVNATLNSGGSIAPGEVFRTGSLNLSNVNWNAGGRYAWQVSNDVGVAGVDWDFFGTSNLTMATEGTFNIDISWLPGTFAYAPAVTNDYWIAGTTNGLFADAARYVLSWNSQLTGSNFGWWATVENGGKDLYLHYGAGEFGSLLVIPEPNVLLLWLSSLATIYAARRRISGRKNS